MNLFFRQKYLSLNLAMPNYVKFYFFLLILEMIFRSITVENEQEDDFYLENEIGKYVMIMQ